MISEVNNRSVELGKELRARGMNGNLQSWVKSGHAIPQSNGVYQIIAANPKQAAATILQHERQRRLETYKVQPDLFTQPECKEQPQMVQRMKRISILWGLVTIEK
jgi:hypothetical protein